MGKVKFSRSLLKKVGSCLGYNKLNFDKCTTQKIGNCNRIRRTMKRLSLILSRQEMLTITNAFARPHLDCIVPT